MAIEIIKEGKIPEKYVYRAIFTCCNCETIFSEEVAQCPINVNAYGAFIPHIDNLYKHSLSCPICGTMCRTNTTQQTKSP